MQPNRSSQNTLRPRLEERAGGEIGVLSAFGDTLGVLIRHDRPLSDVSDECGDALAAGGGWEMIAPGVGDDLISWHVLFRPVEDDTTTLSHDVTAWVTFALSGATAVGRG